MTDLLYKDTPNLKRLKLHALQTDRNVKQDVSIPATYNTLLFQPILSFFLCVFNNCFLGMVSFGFKLQPDDLRTYCKVCFCLECEGQF